MPDLSQAGWLIRAAVWWSAHGLRGRGWVPRVVGRRFPPRQELYVRTEHGAYLSVDPMELDVFAVIANSGGTWDRHVLHGCQQLLRPGDVFYDIGANTGLFSLDSAMAIRDIAVYAFEPQPGLVAHIRKSVEKNGLKGVRVLETMLGATDGSATLYLTSHSIHASTVPREKRFRKLERPVRSLDSLLAAKEIAPPDVIKIDVEGAEMDVFRGAAHVLATSQPSIVFEADENMQRAGTTIGGIIDELSRAVPYTFYLIGVDETFRPAVPPHPRGNYLALSPRHRDRLAT